MLTFNFILLLLYFDNDVADLNHFFNRFNFFLLTYWSVPFFILRRKNKKLKLKNFITFSHLKKFNSSQFNLSFGSGPDSLITYNGFFYFQTINELFENVRFLYNHKVFKSLVWLIGIVGRVESLNLDFWALPIRCFLRNIRCFTENNGFIFLSNLNYQLSSFSLLLIRFFNQFNNIFITNFRILIGLLNHLFFSIEFLVYKKNV